MKLPDVVIPAAGDGTRIKDIAFSKPKPLIPVCGKPVICWILETLLTKNFLNIDIIVPNEPDQDPTAIYVKDIYGGLLNLRFERQPKKLGPLHAINLALSKVKTDGVLVFLADTIYLEDISSFNYLDSWILLSVVKDYEPWCLAKVKNGDIEKLYDKPKAKVETDLALIGVYYFHDKDYFQQCAKDVINRRKKIKGEYQISSAIELYLRKYKVKGLTTKAWYDCGSVENLRKTNDLLITKKTRAFNQLCLSTKTGTMKKKSAGEFGSKTLADEISFYSSISKEHKMFFPRVFDKETNPDFSKIEVEYWPLNNLADIFIYFRYSNYLWTELIKNIVNILFRFKINAEYSSIKNDTFIMLWDKTLDRIKTLEENKFDLVSKKEIRLNDNMLKGWPELKEKVKEKATEISKKSIPSILHGDMCFSNILSDISSGIIKLVDPRGKFGKTLGTLGDQRYDIAKLRQSYNGYYDFIINNLYSLYEINEEYKLKIFNHSYHVEISRLFDYYLFRYSESSLDEVKFIEGLLFLSMCPLHYEDKKRQKTFWLIGIQIMNEIFFKQ